MSGSRVLVAPDSFKGTFTATRVAAAAAAGLRSAGLDPDGCPVADGGEGTLDAVAEAVEAEFRHALVQDAIGEPRQARFAVLDGGLTALVEAAEVVGFDLIEVASRDPEAASTVGVGALIAAAVDEGAKRVMLAVGGTVTSDGGAGAVRAIEAAGGLGDAELTVLCDVTNRFEDAASVFAPQKGASPDTVERIAARLRTLAAEYPRDPRAVPRSGAGGGLAGGLWAALGARLESGAARVLELVGFAPRLDAVRAVVVGEGRLDGQTAHGKAIAEIAARARERRLPVHAIVGANELDAHAAARLGLASVTEATTLEEIERSAARLGPWLR